MAIKTPTPPPQSIETLDPSKTYLAGAVASLLGLLATAGAAFGLIWYLTSAEAQTELIAYLLLLTALAVVGLIAGVQLFRGHPGAQQLLLVYWCGVVVAATVLTFAVILWRVPEGLAEQFGEATSDSLTPWVTVLGLVVLVLAALVVGLLAAASQAGSRQRYASIVIVSVAGAIAVAVGANLVAQYENPEKDRKNYLHVSMETLGRYGLSPRTKNVLKDVKTPVRLTCVYTSTDKAKQTEERRERVLELLEDMKIYGEKVTVANVTTDAGKAKLLQRLRGQLGTQADKHHAYVKKFHDETEAFLATLEADRQKWESHPKDSYLNMWSLPVEISAAMRSGIEKLQKAHKKVSDGLAGTSLPDYADLVREIKEATKDFQEMLEKAVELVESVGKIAQAAGEGDKQKAARKAVDDCAAAVQKAVQAVGKANDPDPSKPADVLGAYVAAAREAARQAAAAAKQLDEIAGEDEAALLRENRFYVVPAGMVQFVLSDYYRQLGQLVANEAAEADAVARNAKPDYQKRFIRQVRGKAARIGQSFDVARVTATDFLQRLATVDERSKADLAAADSGDLFKDALAKFKAAIDEADDLPDRKDTSLSTEITGENLVIVEAGDKVAVVKFDEVWPLRVQDFGMSPSDDDAPQKRVFNGDGAIGSKVLSMTQKPFAVVLLAYWGPGPGMPPQMARMIPPSDIPLRALGTVRKRLEQANFAVEDWNLNDDMPDPNEHKDRPKLLIVLPPPPNVPQSPWQRTPQPTPKFQPQHAEKVTRAIRDGTPAIFLASFFMPRRMGMFMPMSQTTYAWGAYLRDEWGIEVMTDYLVVPAVGDEQNPGRYKVDGQRFGYLPLNSFSDDHPIGKPLQSQRVLWPNLCPIRRRQDARGEQDELPEGVAVDSLLTIPKGWETCWATRHIQELLRMFRNVEGSYIWPTYPPEGDDLRAGFDVAVAATRQKNAGKGIEPARIVVLGNASGLLDGYLDREIPLRDAKGTTSLSDPPRANAELLVNSAYWLIGKQDMIASGPVQAIMREIPAAAKVWLVLIYCGLLPAAVLCVGGIVLLIRRR